MGPSGGDDGVENTSAAERVKAIARAISQPHTAGEIADEARVSGKEASATLDHLVDENVLLKHERDSETLYWPDPSHVEDETVQELIDSHSRERLLKLREKMKEQLQETDSDILKYRLKLVEEALQRLD